MAQFPKRRMEVKTSAILLTTALVVLSIPLSGQVAPLSAVTSGNGSALVTWTTSTASSSQVNYGTSKSALTQRASSPALTTNHTVRLTGLTSGAIYYYRAMSVDSGSNSATIPPADRPPSSLVAASSVWGPTTMPGNATEDDPSAIELGMRFQSETAGKITGIRFYKGPRNTGTHLGHLWTSSGSLLASVTFANETASGWQQATFATPVSIEANIVYVVSYHAPSGYYAADENFFPSAANSPPLHALGSEPSFGNGVYQYGSGGFPDETGNGSNYWVDVVFVPTSTSAAPPTATSIWDVTAMPGTVTGPDLRPAEVGLKFQSDIAGDIAGIRFYKSPQNSGTHHGHLWTTDGLLLATATFTNETGLGWQQADFASPVPIQPNTVYIVSCDAPIAHSSTDANFFATAGVYNPPLRALQDGVAGPNGVYLGQPGGFPSSSYNATNFWVDVVFSPLSVSTAPSPSGFANTATATLSSDAIIPLPAGALSQVLHSVSLSWNASSSPNINGYKVYRGTVSGGPYALISSSLVAGTSYVDSVGAGQYYYVTTAVNSSNSESGYSNQAVAIVTDGTFSVLGKVTGSVATLTLSGAASKSTTTDASGNYTFSGLGNGSYVVTPTQAGQIFTPGTAAATISGASVTGVNFTSSAAVPLAVGRLATQSSVFPGNIGPSAAVDGSTDGNYYDRSVSHTNDDINAWWQVDLGSSQAVSAIVVWNRTDCCGDRLSDYWVFISNTSFSASDTPTTLSKRSGTWSSHQTTMANPSAPINVGGAQGRYVRVQLTGTNYLALSEVQVFGYSTALAQGRPAAQSSIYPGNKGPSAAVDGNIDGNYQDNSVSHTNDETNAWWQVDLGAARTVDSIVVWNRTDCCGNRLSDYWVFVSSTPFSGSDTPTTLSKRSGTWNSHQTNMPNPSTTINVGGAQGRYVRVQLGGTNYLALAEVQVLGH